LLSFVSEISHLVLDLRIFSEAVVLILFANNFAKVEITNVVETWKVLFSRVARLFLTKYTKAEKNVPNCHKFIKCP
jgi:hypothetical protein